MAVPVIMPRQGQSVESCIISKWHKKAGDAVKTGDLLFTYETDKSTFDEEAKLDGTFLGAFCEEGDDVPCLCNVCVIGSEGEDWKQFAPKGEAAPAAPAEPELTVSETKPEPAAAPAQETSSSGGVFASPRAKKLAKRLNMDYTKAQATGPNGRVLERDVVAMERSWKPADEAFRQTIGAGSTQSATFVHSDAPEYTDEPLSSIRRAIARNMMQSLQNSAQLTHHLTFDATNVMNFRKQLKAEGEKLSMPNITINDIVIYAVARTLKNHAALNAHYLADKNVLRKFSAVNIGIAVDTERGLLVPTLHSADRLSLCETAAQSKALAKEAQSGTISPDKLSGATFTVSNIGSLGIEMFTPVINPPQTGILGVCAITQRAREVDGEIKLYPAMGLSLTYDHRALDGAPASRFLAELKNNLENFTLLLAK